MFTIGVDIGSVGTKAVLFNHNIIDRIILPTGWSPKTSGREAVDSLLKNNQLRPSDIHKIVVTGYGRVTADFADKTVTEITCHTKGSYFLTPSVKTIIDIGGQDSKVIRVDSDGNVVEFLMNDKCAAGTGRFIQVMSHLLEVELEDFDRLASQGELHKISSMCTVFAESEVIGLLANGTSKAAVARGILDAIASRTVSMVHKISPADDILFTGGVSKFKSLVSLLEEKLDRTIYTDHHSQFAGALGAALIAHQLK